MHDQSIIWYIIDLWGSLYIMSVKRTIGIWYITGVHCIILGMCIICPWYITDLWGDQSIIWYIIDLWGSLYIMSVKRTIGIWYITGVHSIILGMCIICPWYITDLWGDQSIIWYIIDLWGSLYIMSVKRTIGIWYITGVHCIILGMCIICPWYITDLWGDCTLY